MTRPTHQQIAEELAAKGERLRHSSQAGYLPQPNLFPNTFKALDEWFAEREIRNAAHDAIADRQSLRFWEELEREATEKLQAAFYEDTKHINSRAHCGLVSPWDAIKMTGYPG